MIAYSILYGKEIFFLIVFGISCFNFAAILTYADSVKELPWYIIFELQLVGIIQLLSICIVLVSFIALYVSTACILANMYVKLTLEPRLSSFQRVIITVPLNAACIKPSYVTIRHADCKCNFVLIQVPPILDDLARITSPENYARHAFIFFRTVQSLTANRPNIFVISYKDEFTLKTKLENCVCL